MRRLCLGVVVLLANVAGAQVPRNSGFPSGQTNGYGPSFNSPNAATQGSATRTQGSTTRTPTNPTQSGYGAGRYGTVPYTNSNTPNSGRRGLELQRGNINTNLQNNSRPGTAGQRAPGQTGFNSAGLPALNGQLPNSQQPAGRATNQLTLPPSQPGQYTPREQINRTFTPGSTNTSSRPTAPANTPAQKPIATRQTTFSIPFQVANFDDSTVVELHVSADRGRNWYVYARQRPQTGRFQFTAKRDGEYWFASRTIRGNAVANRQPVQPQLRMLVDSTRPQLKIDAIAGGEGKVVVNWDAIDKNLQAASLKIEYQTRPNTAWKPVPQKPQNQVTATQLKGQVSWSPKASASSVLVRVEVRDTAGNIAAATHRLVMPKSAGNPGNSALANRATAGAIPWNANSSNNVATPAKQGSSEEYRPGDTYRPVPKKPNPAVSSQIPSTTETNNQTNVATTAPAGTRWTSSSKFMLEYDVDGSDQIADVELWVTEDGGKQWQRWGTDPDRRSPLPVAVETPGVYGFRIVVISKRGVVGDKPKAGDNADIWIGVDNTKPTVRLAAVEAGKGANAGAVVIRWEASDTALGDSPATIEYRPRGGNWQTVARQIPNTGQYTWRPAQPLAGPIDVRVVIEDEAGNRADDQATNVTLSTKPRGRINSFNPIGQ